MASYKTLFKEKKNQNWLKASVAVDITRKGLIPFVTTVLTALHQDIRANVEGTNCLPPGAICNSCITPNVLRCGTKGVCGGFRSPCKFHQHAHFRNCPAKICNDFKLEIEGHHRFNFPSWKSTNANDWCTNPWEVAKCFLPPDGYLNVQTADETDINGIINLIINCTFFENYFKDDLSQPHNICTKVRDVGKSLRHSPKIMVSDADLSNCIDALKTLLQDCKSLASNTSAKDALANLALLENDQLRVSTDDLANVISNAISTTSEMLETGKNLQDRMDELKELEYRIQTLADEAVQRIGNAEKDCYSSKSAALKQDLEKHYLESCSVLNLGPMFNIHSPDLVEVYTPPQLSMSTVSKGTSNLGIGFNSNIFRSEIKVLDEVFRNARGQAKTIYITAKAGVGKSSFCKFIVRVWCAFQTNNTEEIEILKSRGAGTYLNICEELKNVQYVFYARLQSRSRLCEMDDIVYHQIIRRLSRCEDYDKRFLQEILTKERCLMIFDGLDEWSHPDVKENDCFEEDTESPHARNRENCTVMITSRHWKLGLQKMHSEKSSLCVEIEQLNSTNIRSLLKLAFTLLVGDSESNVIVEFFRFIDNKGLGDLFGSTLVALQLLSLWYEGRSLGETKCQVYCNVLEMMFANALKRNPDVQQYVAEDHQQPDTIKCLQTRRHCMRFQEYIRNLGKMAFYSLFDVETLETQIEGNPSTCLSSCRTEELGLLTGLISKTQLHSSSVNPRYEYNFLHKTYQEMLACIYINSIRYDSEEYERIVETIKTSIKTFDIFWFVCDERIVKTIMYPNPTLSIDMLIFLCGMHGPCAKEMFEIYCDLQTTMICQVSEIEYSVVLIFHENCSKIIKEIKANAIASETAMKMHSLLIDRTCNYSNTMCAEDYDDISFLAFEMNELENICVFHSVQVIAEYCKDKLKFISIKISYDTDYNLPCPIAPATINSCTQLHTLILTNFDIAGELDLTGCSSLSCLDLSQAVAGDQVRLIISPNRLKRCSINEGHYTTSYIVSIKCTCPFNSELLEQLVLFNVKLEDDLRLLYCEQLQILDLVNVDTTDITTNIKFDNVTNCGLGSFTASTIMDDAIKSLQHSKRLKRFVLWHFNDALSTCLNETLLSVENIEEVGFYGSNSPLMDLHIPMSVRELEFCTIIISAECLMKLINNSKANYAGVHFNLEKCYVSVSYEVTIETIIEEIKRCKLCVLKEESLGRGDEMDANVIAREINVFKLDFIMRGRQNELH